MNLTKRILTIQDISCVGQCSLTVALPIISAAGIETAVLPTAVLSTHTGGFEGFTFCDLTEEMPKIENHWKKEHIFFDGAYTGYIGSIRQIDYILSIFSSVVKKDGIIVVDPCMADHGKLYPGFSSDFPKEMLRLCQRADILVPNMTEMCLLLEKEYKEQFTKEEIEQMVISLADKTDTSIVLTGVSFSSNQLGCCIYHRENKTIQYYFTEKIPYSFHGTGDCFASSFFAGIMKNLSLEEAVRLACEFTYQALSATVEDRKEHWYGVHFEKALYLLNSIK